MFISFFCRNFAHVIELERHIEILLLSNDCVIVPGLGGFMTHHVEARYDERDNMFLPPLRTLGFNPQLNINDSLLAQSYIEAYDISYPEALQRIEDEVNELRQHLQNEGSYELNDIGLLELNDEGKYVFTPCEAGILTPALYGLSSFEMKPLEQPVVKPAPVVVQEPQPIEEPFEEPVEQPVAQVIDMEPEPETETIDEQEEPDDVVRIKYSWIRNAVAAAAILVAIFILALPSGKTDVMTRSISNLNNGLFFGLNSKDTNTSKISIEKNSRSEECGVRSENTQKADSIAKSVAEAQAKSVADSAALSSATGNPAPLSTLETPQKTICIVLASYVSMRNANAFIERLQKQGFDQAEIFERNNIRRVIYGHYASEEAAHDDLRRFHRQSETAEAWIMSL